MKKMQDISHVLRQLRAPASSNLDERVYGEIAKTATAAPTAPSGPELTLGQILTLFLKKKATLYTLATTLGLVLVAVLVLSHSTSSAWAMEQAIEALKKYRAVHISGYIEQGETKMSGIGVVLEVKGTNLVIADVVHGSPAAAHKGIHVGDRITAVAQEEGPAVLVETGKLAETLTLIRGPAGTTVRLTIVPSGADDSQARVVSVRRAEFKTTTPEVSSDTQAREPNGTTGGKTAPLDVWARSDATGNLVETGLAKTGDYTVWTRDNKTYLYDRAHKTVFVEPCITFGLNPFLGPKLLAVLATMKDYKAFEGEDPATGQKRVMVTCSIENTTGPESFRIEFDARTKLPVSTKVWRNLKQEGEPRCVFEKIIYFQDLPDSAFNFEPPAGTPFKDRPLTIPEASLPALSNPKSGISAEGMTREQACQRILEQVWAARANNDLARVRQLCPATATWSDELLLASELLAAPNGQDGKGQLVKIGGIERTGRSKLGPLALVPTWVRYPDGTVREFWMIVQFRETGKGASCVVFGTHGYALNVKE